MTFLSPPFFCDSVLSHTGLDGKRFFCMFSTFVLTTFVDNLKTLSSYSTHLDLFSFTLGKGFGLGRDVDLGNSVFYSYTSKLKQNCKHR